MIKIKVSIDFDNKSLRVYTLSNLKGEVYSDLPDSGLYPAVQNMTMRCKNAMLKFAFTFDL